MNIPSMRLNNPFGSSQVQVLSGRVNSFRSISTAVVHVMLDTPGVPPIELFVYRWVIERGDVISVSGTKDEKTGKFIGIAYHNQTKSVRGVSTSDDAVKIGFLGLVSAVMAYAPSWVTNGSEGPMTFRWAANHIGSSPVVGVYLLLFGAVLLGIAHGIKNTLFRRECSQAIQ